jgi:ribosomal protein L12E/L44/L45/RPP1/RPP2
MSSSSSFAAETLTIDSMKLLPTASVLYHYLNLERKIKETEKSLLKMRTLKLLMEQTFPQVGTVKGICGKKLKIKEEKKEEKEEKKEEKKGEKKKEEKEKYKGASDI